MLGLALSFAAGPTRADDPTPGPSVVWNHLDAAGAPVVDLWFGWSSTCPHCSRARAWLSEFAPTAPWLVVHGLQVDGADAQPNIDRLVAIADGIGERIDGVPAFLFDRRLWTGFDDAATTGAHLEVALSEYRDRLLAAASKATVAAPTALLAPTLDPGAASTPLPASAAGPTSDAAGDETAITLPIVGPIAAGSVSLPVLAVVLGGLDAVNPCALSILLFLVSALVASRSRSKIVLVGGAFVAATAVIYFLLMAAWLNAFLWLGDLRIVTALAGAAAIVAGLINIKDFGWFRRGPSLMLPESARPAIFGRILDLSETVALPALVGTTILVAATASAYEMLCTGGFPVVFTRVLTLADLPPLAYYGYLALYCFVYVLPMLAIVGLFAITLGTRGVSITEARRLKLLSGFLMVGVGALLLFAPERLSDLTWTIGLFAAAILAWAVVVSMDRARHVASHA